MNASPPLLPEPQRFVGFGKRFVATLVDTFWLMLISLPVLVWIYGWDYFNAEHGLVAGMADFLISYILPIVVVIVFWIIKQATPGKMVVHAKIVDAKTGANPTTGQFLIRYLGYYVSLLPLGMGFFWIIWDPKKQGWHDKIAKTLVIDTRPAALPPPLPD